MLDKINSLLAEIEEFSAKSKEHVEEYRIKWLSKKAKLLRCLMILKRLLQK